MRLLKVNDDGSFSLTPVIRTDIPKYAILSHTWEADDQELTFSDLGAHVEESKTGYRKIQFCASRAKQDGLQYIWIDSCCINKSSDAELTEALNSMFRWYRNAAKCYVYLSDVPTDDTNSEAFSQSRWFTRGWTLQELLAPSSVEFFTSEGVFIGNKKSLELQIHDITGIPIAALREAEGLFRFSVKERMTWAATRQTSIEEDQAYCQLGIFDVHLPLIYGEGKKHALRRLQEEIDKVYIRDSPSFPGSKAQQADDCLSQLAAADQTRFLTQALQHSSKDACRWLLEKNKYISWHDDKNSSGLVITAKAGYGKTTLIARVHDMNSTLLSPGDLVVKDVKSNRVILYFFFQRTSDESLRTALAALKAVVHQIVCKVPEALSAFVKRYELLSVRGEFEWCWETLSSTFNEVLNSLSPKSEVYLLLDALDECDAESCTLMLNLVRRLIDTDAYSGHAGISKPILKILITSRPDGDMLDRLWGFPIIEVNEDDTKSDINTVIQSRMEDFAHRRHLQPAIANSIIDFLKSNAHGMYLWIMLIMKELERRDERLTDEVIVSKLSSIPLSLVDTYETILHSVPSTRKQDMWRIIRWLLFGSRNLTVAELEKASCLESQVSAWHDFAGDLQFLCGSLIRVSPAGEVCFVHQTARDFLRARVSARQTASEIVLDMTLAGANDQMALTCTRYLLGSEIMSRLQRLSLRLGGRGNAEISAKSYLEQLPFLQYAIESWHLHARKADPPSPTLTASIQRLLSEQNTRNGIIIITILINRGRLRNVPTRGSPLHLAVYLGIPWLTKLYVTLDPGSVHICNTMKDTPLIWASEKGNVECARILLDAGANPNSFELDRWSALHWAARNGHLEMCSLLLEHFASVNHTDRNGYTPLDWAVDREHWEVADMLERWGAKCGRELKGGFVRGHPALEGSASNISSTAKGRFRPSRPGRLQDARPDE